MAWETLEANNRGEQIDAPSDNIIAKYDSSEQLQRPSGKSDPDSAS